MRLRMTAKGTGMLRPGRLCYEPPMKLRALLLCAAASAAVLSATELVEGIVARVNDKLITQSEFDSLKAKALA